MGIDMFTRKDEERIPLVASATGNEFAKPQAVILTNALALHGVRFLTVTALAAGASPAVGIAGFSASVVIGVAMACGGAKQLDQWLTRKNFLNLSTRADMSARLLLTAIETVGVSLIAPAQASLLEKAASLAIVGASAALNILYIQYKTKPGCSDEELFSDAKYAHLPPHQIALAAGSLILAPIAKAEGWGLLPSSGAFSAFLGLSSLIEYAVGPRTKVTPQSTAKEVSNVTGALMISAGVSTLIAVGIVPASPYLLILIPLLPIVTGPLSSSLMALRPQEPEEAENAPPPAKAISESIVAVGTQLGFNSVLQVGLGLCKMLGHSLSSTASAAMLGIGWAISGVIGQRSSAAVVSRAVIGPWFGCSRRRDPATVPLLTNPEG